MTTLLPQHSGLLPWFLLIDALLSWFNTFNCFLNPSFNAEIYIGPSSTNNVTPLSMRTFGSWTILSGFVRLYAAYNIDNPVAYALAFWAFVAISVHYCSEIWVYRTMKLWQDSTVVSLLIDVGGMVWMWWVWEGYVGMV